MSEKASPDSTYKKKLCLWSCIEYGLVEITQQSNQQPDMKAEQIWASVESNRFIFGPFASAEFPFRFHVRQSQFEESIVPNTIILLRNFFGLRFNFVSFSLSLFHSLRNVNKYQIMNAIWMWCEFCGKKTNRRPNINNNTSQKKREREYCEVCLQICICFSNSLVQSIRFAIPYTRKIFAGKIFEIPLIQGKHRHFIFSFSSLFLSVPSLPFAGVHFDSTKSIFV